MKKLLSAFLHSQHFKRNLIIAIASLLTVALAITGVVIIANNNDSGGSDGKRVPVYQGMTISSAMGGTASHIGNFALASNTESGQDDEQTPGKVEGDFDGRNEAIDKENPYPENSENETIEEEIKSSLDVIGSTQSIYYATPGEDIYINIHINNPDSFEIMSFTLNGKKYSSYMFEEGSDMETIVLKYNVGAASGIVEYTIDAIKYIDGTEIKDVIISGNKTVKAGIRGDNKVVANVSDVEIETNSISFNVNIKDNDKLIKSVGGMLKAVIYDGSTIISVKNLSVDNNSVTFNSLRTNTLYQYAIVGYFDDLSGSGFKMNVLYKDTFYTDSVVLFDNVDIGYENINFDLLWNENCSNKTLLSLKLYQEDDLISNLDLNAKTATNLLTDNNYKLIAEYKNQENTERIYLEFRTLAKFAPDPIISNTDKTQTSLDFSFEFIDTYSVGAIDKVEFIHGSDVTTLDILDTYNFTDLLSNNEYILRVTYTYDLNDGKGAQTETKNLAIKTEAKEKPIFNIAEPTITASSIKGTYTLTDEDNILNSFKVELYNEGVLIEENAEKEIDFSSLNFNKDYVIKITYTYDANDGNGIVEATEERLAKTYVDVSEFSVINTSAVSEGETIFVQIKLDNPFGASISSVVINGVEYNVMPSSTDKKLFIEIVYNDQFKGGDTYLKVDKINATLNGEDYLINSKNDLSDNVFINGKVEVLSVEYADEEFKKLEDGSWCFPSDKIYVLITLDNPTGYEIDSFSSYTKLDNNRYYYEATSWQGWSRAINISKITYHNDYISKSISFNSISSKNSIYRVASSEIKYISTPNDLKKMNEYYYYELKNDIDLSGLEWIQYIYYGNAFHGVFNGNGYSIKNMSFVGDIENPDAYLGLFSEGDGIIQSLKIEEATIIANATSDYKSNYGIYYGGFVAYTNGRLDIYECEVDEYTSVSIKTQSGDAYVGGLVGYGGSTINITNSYNSGNISGSNAGGLVGYSSSTINITNSYNSGSVSAISSRSYYTYAGGLVGHGYNITISNSYNSGIISATSNESYTYTSAGGLVGYGSPTITDSYNSGNVSATTTDNYYAYAGGLVGLRYEWDITITNSYSLVNGYGYNGEACTVEQLNSKEFYTDVLGWSEDIWDFSELDVENGKNPTLKAF